MKKYLAIVALVCVIANNFYLLHSHKTLTNKLEDVQFDLQTPQENNINAITSLYKLKSSKSIQKIENISINNENMTIEIAISNPSEINQIQSDISEMLSLSPESIQVKDDNCLILRYREAR